MSRRPTSSPSGARPAAITGTGATTPSMPICATASCGCGGRLWPANCRRGKRPMTARWRWSSCWTSFPATCFAAMSGPIPAMRSPLRSPSVPSRAAPTSACRPICWSFCYLPLMHSEHLADQQRCVELFRNTANADNLRYAEEHADIIRRFGRFPHRNLCSGTHHDAARTGLSRPRRIFRRMTER